MAISVLFSWVIYSVSMRELNTSLHRQDTIFRNLPEFGDNDSTYLTQLPDVQLTAAEHRLQLNLTTLNLGILVLAGGASFWLARRTLQPIESALETQGRFTADASHELRTPLTAMKTEIEVALREPELGSPEAKILLQSNLEEISKLESLSNALLQLAQHDSTKPSQDVSALPAVAADALSRLHKVIKQRGVFINNEITAGHVIGDHDSLVELIVILLDNAIKYSDRKATVVLSARQRGHVAEISVRDHGRGIKASEIPHLFDRFYRADASRSKDKVEGYGLGLSIAKKIVDMHRGTIEVSSTPGKGSTFTVKLPAPRA